ncbi:putative DNA-binding transcriptional regulator AlpA [Pseudacidovorax sp. 1753]|uniref:helix-turn-helix transcriptional regulator n=1 Tax=Pseudacidovorax sp. 1753 TaxID=3156419 RepID=UPI003391D9EB
MSRNTTKPPAEPAPETLYREKLVLSRFAPVHRTTWWRWIKAGKAPAPVAIGPHAVAWRGIDLARWQRGEWVKPEPGSLPNPA